MRAFVLLGLLSLAACSTESRVTPLMTGTAPMPAAKNWGLSVRGCEKPAECNAIRVEVLAALLNGYVVEGIVPPGQAAPATLDVAVSKVRDVSMGERMLLGVMAGRSEVDATVTLKNEAGAPLRSFQVHAASASHPLSGKSSTQDAYRQLGADIVAGLR